MSFSVILIQMIVLFSIVVAGFVSGRFGLMDKDFSRKLSGLIINLTCPCLILSSTMGDTLPDRSLILPLLGTSTLTYVLLLVAAKWIPRILPIAITDRGIYSFMIAFGNVGFIGYPVVASMFGHEAIFYASVLNVPNTLCVFIWGAQFVAGDGQGGFKWSRLYSPALIATYLSILIVAFKWQTPEFIAQPLTLIGGITVPGALLIIGNSINHIPLRRMAGSKPIYLMAALRLFILPLGILYLFRFLEVNPLVANINTMIIAMPVASFGTMFCLRFGKDDTLMTQGTFITTLLSLGSIPLLAAFIAG